MRYFLILILFSSAQVLAKSYADMFDIVYRNKLYYSSYVFLKKAVEEGQKIDESKVTVCNFCVLNSGSAFYA